MSQIWVVLKETGEFQLADSHPVAAFSREEPAQLYVSQETAKHQLAVSTGALCEYTTWRYERVELYP